MEERYMNRTIRFLEGMLLGVLVGAAVAILLAPSSGEELRNQIQLEIDRVQSEMQQAAEQRRLELEHQLADLRAPRGPADQSS